MSIQIDGVNNIFHLFVINNDIVNLRKINEIHKFDWTMKNRNNKTCLELAKENKNCEMIEEILNNIHEESIFNFKNVIDNQKNIQKEAFEKSIRLTTENINFKQECEELRYNNHDLQNKYDKLWKINYITCLSLAYFLCKLIFSNV